MTKKSYDQLFAKIRKNHFFYQALTGFATYIPYVYILIYGICALYLLITEREKLIRFVLVPAICFIAVTIVRKLINRTRPYDQLGFTPLVDFKPGKGQSFPSRHTASSFIIGFACFYVHPMAGIFVILMAIFVALSRILTGMHYPSDILAAVIFSSIFAYFGL